MARFASGKKSKAISDISGFKVRYTQLKTTWDNLRVEPEEYSSKHPQLTPAKNVVDATALFNPRPDNDPENVEIVIGRTFDISLSKIERAQQGVGIHALSSVGRFAIELEEARTGVAGIGAIGTASAGAGVNGTAGTGNIGSSTPQDQVDQSASGVEGQSGIGAIGLGAVITGVAGNDGIGTIALSFDRVFDVPNTVSGTGATGIEVPEVETPTLTGVAGTGATGNETVGSEPSANGVSGTGAIGAFGEAGDNQLSLSVIPVSATGTANIGIEDAQALILEQSDTGWNEQHWNYGVWGGDGNIEGIGAIGTVTVDPFNGPNPVNSVSGTGGIGNVIFDQDISFTTGWNINAWNSGTWSGTDTSMGIGADGQIGTISINNSVEISSGVAGTGTTGTEGVGINNAWNEGTWNDGTWSN